MSSYYTGRVAWLFASMGFNESLLYWEPIIREYLKQVPDTVIFTSETKIMRDGEPLPISNKVKWRYVTLLKSKSNYPTTIHYIGPGIIYTLHKYKPDVVVINEFSLLSLYGLFYTKLSRHTKSLLLVEAKPTTPESFVRKFYKKFICRLSDKILTNNTDGFLHLVNNLKISDNKIIKSPYLISIPANSSDANIDTHLTPINKQKCIFLFVGKLVRRKGLKHLFESCKMLSDDYRDRYEVWIVGDGEDEDMIKSHAQRLNLDTQVIFHGRKPYNELNELYKKADVFVFPTLKDYRALVGFEAIHYGLPVIHSKYDGAVSEVVKDGINGFSFDPYNHEELKTHLEFFIDNRDRINEFSKESKTMSQNFTVEIAAETLAKATLTTGGKNYE